MDYHKFITTLPALYEEWGKHSVRTKTSKFKNLLDKLNCVGNENLLQLLNFAVASTDSDEIYCQIGCSTSINLVGALLDNPLNMAYVVDNFSHSNSQGQALENLLTSLSSFYLEEQICVEDKTFEEFFCELNAVSSEDKIGVCFYNAACDYRSQLLALLLVKPFLSEKSLIIINNSSYSSVKQASWDFIATHPQCHMLLDVPKSKNKNETDLFGNGIYILAWNSDLELKLDWDTYQRNHDYLFIKMISELETEIGNQRKKVDEQHKEALSLYHSRQFSAAEYKFKQIIDIDNKSASAWLNLGTLYYATERYSEAIQALQYCLAIDSSGAIQHYSLGLVLEKIGATSQAIQAYQNTIDIEPKFIDAYNQLGNLFLQLDNFYQAEIIFKQAITAMPEHFGSYLNLGNLLLEQERIQEAIETYEKALKLKPRDPDIYYNLGIAFEIQNDKAKATLNYGYSFYTQGKYHEAIECYQNFLKTSKGDIDFYLALADCYKYLNLDEETIQTYKDGLNEYPLSSNIFFYLIITLQHFGRLKEAIEVANKASELLPNIVALRIEKQRLLPIVYETQEEIDFYRDRFTKGLRELIQKTNLDSPEAMKNALEGVNCHTNFYLQYQCKNDTELQKQYGQFIHQIMAASYPEWVKPLSISPLSQGEKIRIGYISCCIRDHTVGKLMLGWLRNCNHEEFELHTYYTDRIVDSLTQQFRLHSDYFHHISHDLEALCKQILADKIHILVFLDIGMYPEISKIASLRLAPVQCVTWGHPITSGIPTIDYFLSCELMETNDSQKYYSEKLILLPNIGISYAKPIIPEVTKSRSEFGLRENSVVYISCQSLYKYLPQYDYVFPAIAQKVSNAQFVFLSHRSAFLTDIFKQRLKRSFAEFALNSEDYCVILPRLNWQAYCNVNLISDIFLDTLGWSGGNTALEAIACNLPIVTYPGEFMRGRHSYGILKMLGVTETIAQSQAEYIDIATKLGLDSKWRSNIVKSMLERQSYLYDDKTCVFGLEAFYKRVIQKFQKVISNDKSCLHNTIT